MFVTTLTVLTVTSVTWLVVAEDSRVEQPSCEVLITKWTKWSSPGPGTVNRNTLIKNPLKKSLSSYFVVVNLYDKRSNLNRLCFCLYIDPTYFTDN